MSFHRTSPSQAAEQFLEEIRQVFELEQLALYAS
jgi:LysR family hca operon transcriptional activator